MSKNSFLDRDENQLVERIKKLERIVEELKANQVPSKLDLNNKIQVNYVDGRIIMNDGTTDRLLMGEDI